MADPKAERPKAPLPEQIKPDPQDSRYDHASTFGKGWNR